MKQALEKIIAENNYPRPDFFNIISKELSVIDDNFNFNLAIQSKLLREIIRYLLSAGGKRIRPALCLLIAKATGEITKKHLILAELTELIHTASLVHDDIIDSAKLRRGRETINNLWNDKISVITGDFLFAQASVRLGELENNEIVKIYSDVLSNLCDGEIEQYSFKFNVDISLGYYLNKCTTKTASLFASACKSAAILNNQNSHAVNLADDFGENIGIAFQIIDDILDFTGSIKEAAKDTGSDLKQGIITAPVLFALNSKDKRRTQLRSLITDQFNNNENDFHKAVGLITELGGFEEAKKLAVEYTVKGKENLSFVHDKGLKNHLEKVADYILDRV